MAGMWTNVSSSTMLGDSSKNGGRNFRNLLISTCPAKGEANGANDTVCFIGFDQRVSRIQR